VGNKIDRIDRVVPREEGEAVSTFYQIKLLETSALTGENVNDVFYTVVSEVLKKKTINPQVGGNDRANENNSSLKLTEHAFRESNRKAGKKDKKCC